MDHSWIYFLTGGSTNLQSNGEVKSVRPLPGAKENALTDQNQGPGTASLCLKSGNISEDPATPRKRPGVCSVIHKEAFKTCT